ncbi:hypothetical protein [Ralstonia phage RP13]|nr:hypothetical protein [Ralstonia phage RP13]
MLLLGVDLETGHPFSVKPQDKDTLITEVGMIQWDTELKCPVEIFGKILDLGKEVDSEPASVTGITTEVVKKHGVKVTSHLVEEMYRMVQKADYLVAQNGMFFDKPILETFFKEWGIDISDKKWLDTMSDVDYPPNCRHNNLVYLTGYHGLINNFSHRAVGDVMVMLQVLDRYDLDKVIANALSDKLVVKAVVSYDNKDQAKKAGFNWERIYGKNYPSQWVQVARENELEALRAQLSFPIEVVEVWSSQK